MIHKHKPRPTEGAAPERVWTWCGRSVPPTCTTKALPEVECAACRDAFVVYLKGLPDVVRVIEEREP